MTQEQLAKVISYSSSTVAMIETACRKPKPDLIQRCDRELETGGALERLYDELVSREVTPDWLDRWKKIEAGASGLNSFELFVIPGLLQRARLCSRDPRGGISDIPRYRCAGERQTRTAAAAHPR
jgi:hypothetical protein